MLVERHAEFWIGMSDLLDQLTFFRLAGNDRRSVVATDQQAVTVIDAQTTLAVGIGGVAGIAVGYQEGADFLFKKLDSG